MIGAVAQELIDQIAIGAVHFDPVEAGLDRVAGTLTIGVDQRGNFFKQKRPRRRDFNEFAADKGLRLGANRRRRDRYLAIRLQRDMRNTADMPELRKMRPPRACTACVTCFQPAICSAEWIPGVAS